MLRAKFNKIFKRYLLTGMLVIVPMWITIVVLQALISITDSALNILPSKINPQTYFPIPGMGVIIVLILIIIVGALTSNYFGKKLINMVENFFNKIPFVRTIYQGVKQLMEGTLADKGSIFSRVVLVEFPRKGMFFIGFVTGITRQVIQDQEKTFVKVFIPTTPNPTSGFFCLLPEEDVQYLNISTDEAFKLIISAGYAEKGFDQLTTKK
jgi:uncharacterized membrane protein